MNKQFWSRRIADIEPYVPGEQPKDKKYVKLNTNENPYPPSPRVAEAAERVASADLRLYPDPDCTALKESLASFYGLSPEQVFVGNGSDELLAFSFLAFTDENTPAVFPDITYSFYPVYGQLFGVERAGRLAFERLIAQGKVSRDAVYFFADDYLARGALTALANAGLKAPADIRIATWANAGLGPDYLHELSRMEMDPVRAGATIAKAVLSYLKNGTYPDGIVIGPKWIAGETLNR